MKYKRLYDKLNNAEPVKLGTKIMYLLDGDTISTLKEVCKSLDDTTQIIHDVGSLVLRKET